MTEQQTGVQLIQLGGKNYDFSTLDEDTKALVGCLSENQQLQAHHVASHRQLQLSVELLQAKLAECLEGVEPVSVEE